VVSSRLGSVCAIDEQRRCKVCEQCARCRYPSYKDSAVQQQVTVRGQASDECGGDVCCGVACEGDESKLIRSRNLKQSVQRGDLSKRDDAESKRRQSRGKVGDKVEVEVTVLCFVSYHFCEEVAVFSVSVYLGWYVTGYG
jgi:hypothetical protein